jgi:hypothetical protein
MNDDSKEINLKAVIKVLYAKNKITKRDYKVISFVQYGKNLDI